MKGIATTGEPGVERSEVHGSSDLAGFVGQSRTGGS